MKTLSMLKSTTQIFLCALPDPVATSQMNSGIDAARLEVANLNRPADSPARFLYNPCNGALIWVEGEPKDWREQLEAIAAGRNDIAVMRAVGGLN